MTRMAVISIGVLMSASAALADMTASEAKRLNEAASVVRELRAIPEKGIPEDTWNRAECVAVIPSLKKAAFIVGGEFGKGVVSCRSGQTWSAPLFLEMQKGSAGLQVGAEQIDLVLLMMNRKGVERLLDNKLNLGADASVAAGPVGRAGSASTDARLTAEILAYSRAQGAFAGIDVSGGVLRADKDANENTYGRAATSRDVLFTNRIAAPQAADALLRVLKEESRATTGRKQ
jgi:lipid-binding SYLF domain-containing protein